MHAIRECLKSELVLASVKIYFAIIGATTPKRIREQKQRQEFKELDELAAETPLHIEEVADPLTDAGTNASFGKRISCTLIGDYDGGL